jgi:cell division control protein 6
MFERASTIIRDGSKLDYDYVPKVLMNREEQMRSMETLFTPLARDGRACTAFLTGGVGTGKTVTAKRFCADMTEYCNSKGVPLDTIYVNCRNRNSEAAVILQLIRHFDKGFPDRGFSSEEMSRVLRTHLAGNTRMMVVILDEVDLLLKKGGIDLVYQLTRFSEGAESPGKVSLIMISQYSIDGMLDQASLSTFKRANKVVFDKYTEHELYDIVKARADEAIMPGKIREEAIGMIAKVSSDYGDARMAIELLDKSANIAEGDTAGEIDPEHVRAAKAMIYSSVSESKLVSLDMNRRLTLLAVSRAMKDNMEIPISAAEKTYAVVCEEYEYPARKHTQFWGYVQDLERSGLLRTEVRSDGSGRTTLISIPDIPARVLADKMAEILDGNASGGSDEVRALRPRGGHVHQVQRHAPLRRALRPLRGEEGQEGDPQADRRASGR